MSLIRKPVAAERESSLRRAAEATIAGGRTVGGVGQDFSRKAGRALGKLIQIWLLVAFTFGALTASSTGARVLGLTIMAPFWYLALRRRKPSGTLTSTSSDFNRPVNVPCYEDVRTGRGNMQSFYYRPGKNAAGALLLGLFAFLSGSWGLEPGHHAWLAFAAICALGAVICAMNAISSAPALSFDRTGIRMRSTFGKLQEVPWRSVHAIDIQVLTLRYMGIIPVSRNEILYVSCDGGLFGTRKLRLSAKALQLPPGGAVQLLAMLRQAQLDAVGEAGVAMAGAGPKGWGAGDTHAQAEPAEIDFDPDAAIARYLARKDAERAQPADLRGAAAQPQMQRPVFGRRTA